MLSMVSTAQLGVLSLIIVLFKASIFETLQDFLVYPLYRMSTFCQDTLIVSN